MWFISYKPVYSANRMIDQEIRKSRTMTKDDDDYADLNDFLV